MSRCSGRSLIAMAEDISVAVRILPDRRVWMRGVIGKRRDVSEVSR